MDPEWSYHLNQTHDAVTTPTVTRAHVPKASVSRPFSMRLEIPGRVLQNPVLMLRWTLLTWHIHCLHMETSIARVVLGFSW
ncbi:hypothetical protein AFCA_008991 [Aspergillus flavus]|nr:hypothetical protein AFCA_008991 [Aspergillus flavus]